MKTRREGSHLTIRLAPDRERGRRPSVVLVCPFCSASTTVRVDPGLYFGSRAFWECLECQKQTRFAPPGERETGR